MKDLFMMMSERRLSNKGIRWAVIGHCTISLLAFWWTWYIESIKYYLFKYFLTKIFFNLCFKSSNYFFSSPFSFSPLSKFSFFFSFWSSSLYSSGFQSYILQTDSHLVLFTSHNKSRIKLFFQWEIFLFSRYLLLFSAQSGPLTQRCALGICSDILIFLIQYFWHK